MLKASVRCRQAHFTCAIHNSSKWPYFDDLNKFVKEFISLDFLQVQFPGGWFFAVFELIDENHCLKEHNISKKYQTTKNLHLNKRTAPKVYQGNVRQKRRELETSCNLPEDVEMLNQHHDNRIV